MNNKRKKTLNILEIVSLLFVAFFIYNFFLKETVANIKFSDIKQSASLVFAELQQTSTELIKDKNYVNLFQNEHDIINKFSKTLDVNYICKDSKNENCWSKTWLWERLKKPGIKLKSEPFIISELSSTDCKNNKNIANTCGALYIDINGEKEPNKIGIDIIKIYITKDKLVPAGVKEDEVNPAWSCNLINKFSWACTAKLLGMN